MSRSVNLDSGWSFRRLGETGSEAHWVEVDLPHSPFISDPDGRNHWFGECEYRRTLQVPSFDAGGRVLLYVGAAMQSARIFANQIEIACHEGGFLPFEVDLTEHLSGRKTDEILLRLDNRENSSIPPGKPHEELDFCWYGGLYRTVELRIRPALHITTAISAGAYAGGGVFIRTLSAANPLAVVRVETHVRNAGTRACNFRVHAEWQFAGAVVAAKFSESIVVSARDNKQVGLDLNIAHPNLWSPDTPHLYEVNISLVAPDGRVVDEYRERFGVRRIAFSRAQGFRINGRRCRLRGTNRHQEMPHVGYAVPRAAQYRDAYRIKEAGFDYVRLSHYPQSPHFLDACDELGIVVMNCIPGWQFFGGAHFANACLDNARCLIRRDRNHACVILWELSLNETPMDEAFMAQLHAIGHEEYPGDQMFTCGWLDHFDVFIHSRQHGRIHTWSNADKALVIAEYGDWEYYASNAGFDQTTGAGLLDTATNSRKFRGDGERALRQQALNHMLALNDTLASPAVLDGQWAVFDYARGYDPKRAAVGVMDVFRLPKFSYHFYRSQRDPEELVSGGKAGPNLFIASHWTPASDLCVAVFSNCDEVELSLNGTVVSRHSGGDLAGTRHLPHPPYYFEMSKFTPGTLEAIGYINGMLCAKHSVSTPAGATHLELFVDDLGFFPEKNQSDVLIAHARILDSHGTLCIGETQRVEFAVDGAQLLSPNPVETEAGIASVVVRLPPQSMGFTLNAHSESCPGLPPASLIWERKTPEAIAETNPQIAPLFVSK